MNKLLLCCLLLFLGTPCTAQEKQEQVDLIYQSNMIGLGRTSVYDTYLSPLEYSGINIGLSSEQIKMTNLMNKHLAAQHLFNLNFSLSYNPMETASDYAGFIEYSYGLHYRFKPVNKFQFFVGTQANGMLGFIYNTRNGNNPATGKIHLNLNASAMATYHWHIKSQPIDFRYQISTPFIGVLFSPHYGQSYYEIGLGDNEDLIHFASFHNQLSFRNTLSLEIPLNTTILRFSYVNTIYETTVNELETRIHSNSFYLGFSKNFYSVSGKKQLKNNYKNVF